MDSKPAVKTGPTTLLVLPTQLYKVHNIKKFIQPDKIILWEHPHYFKKYNYNKKKLLLHRASMKYYFDYLVKKRFNVDYIEFRNKPTIPRTQNSYMFDPVDRIKLGVKINNFIESPNFLLTTEEYKDYRKKTDKFIFNNFYMWGKKIVDIIPSVKSKDKFNREKIPKNIVVPKLPKNTSDKKYIDEAKIYVEKYFKNNYGNTDNFIFPVTHASAEKWQKNFFDKKLNKFGPYQDFILNKEPFLFHSCLSSSINIGLINPDDLINYLRPSKQNSIPTVMKVIYVSYFGESINVILISTVTLKIIILEIRKNYHRNGTRGTWVSNPWTIISTLHSILGICTTSYDLCLLETL